MNGNPPRRIPPWRRRDAEPGPIVVVILISLGIMATLAVIALLSTHRIF